jgi:hypothetical protein
MYPELDTTQLGSNFCFRLLFNPDNQMSSSLTQIPTAFTSAPFLLLHLLRTWRTRVKNSLQRNSSYTHRVIKSQYSLLIFRLNTSSSSARASLGFSFPLSYVGPPRLLPLSEAAVLTNAAAA